MSSEAQAHVVRVLKEAAAAHERMAADVGSHGVAAVAEAAGVIAAALPPLPNTRTDPPCFSDVTIASATATTAPAFAAMRSCAAAVSFNTRTTCACLSLDIYFGFTEPR